MIDYRRDRQRREERGDYCRFKPAASMEETVAKGRDRDRERERERHSDGYISNRQASEGVRHGDVEEDFARDKVRSVYYTRRMRIRINATHTARNIGTLRFAFSSYLRSAIVAVIDRRDNDDDDDDNDDNVIGNVCPRLYI